jgi:hypothetical protein
VKVRLPELPKLLFVLSVAAAVFTWGLAVGKYRVFPHDILQYAVDSVQLVVDDFGMRTRTHPGEQLVRSRHQGSDVTRYDPEHTSPGSTLITSFYDNEVGIRLISENGDVINQWLMYYHEVWNGTDTFIPENDRPVDNWHVMSNGIAALPDGSVVFPLGGLVKLDRCGAVVWKIPRRFHHSVEPSPSGDFWVPATRYIRGKSLHRPIRTPYKLDTLARVSPQGEILDEIPVLDLLWNNEILPELFANNRHFSSNRERDVVHLNDIEEIPLEYLDAFPQFSAGDILVSLRQSNLVMVVDPTSRKVKWRKTGPWIQQHDADWQPDGTITVFDNRYDRSPYGGVLGGSNIISIDPKTDKARILYGENRDEHFYTSVQGDHQILPNGNILITESSAGRVFEVTPAGDIVWEYVNRYSETEVFRVRDATRYPPGYFEVSDWRCESNTS